MSTPKIINTNEPVVAHVRVFPSDNGWSWEIGYWTSDVNINTTPPRLVTSPKALRTKRGAIAQMVTKLEAILLRS